jgi:DNA-binding GntR family transcriptional regulator
VDISQKIKDDILNNRLPRGVPLRQNDLSARYGVSRIPIRDALLSLKGEGWLVPNGKAGVMIPDLNWKEAEDLSLMRTELECLLFDLAFDNIREEDIAEARRFLIELNKDNLTLIRRGELNWRFHDALYRAADRPTLHSIVERLNKQAVRYLGFQYGPLGYRKTSENQHQELLILIESGDKNAALMLLRQHIEVAGRLLTNYLKNLILNEHSNH